MLALLAALGSGPVTFLRGRFDPVTRACLAPVVGLAAGTALFTTLEWFWSAERLGWVVVAGVVASIALAVVVSRRPVRTARHSHENGDKGPRLALGRSLVQVALVCVAVALPVTLALAGNHSTGPVAFEVYDATGYIAETDGVQLVPIHAAQSATAAEPNLVTRLYVNYARATQQLDYVPLAAAVNSLVALHSTDTESEYLLAVLVAGALGMYAAIRQTLRRPSWLACVGGLLFTGSFFLQLYFDGSEAAIAGLALLVPFLVVAYSELRCRHPGGLIVTALLLQGLFALYPTLDITLGGALLITLLAVALRHFRTTGREGIGPALGFAGAAAAVVVMAAVFDLVAFDRAVGYWKSLLHGGFVETNFPPLHFPLLQIPGWVAQTRGLYSFALSTQSGVSDFVPAVLIPLLLAAGAVIALRRYPVACVVFVILPVAAAVGGYQVVHNSCGYCEDRSLLPVTPVLVYLAAVGLGVVVISRRRLYQAVGLIGGAVFAVTGAISAWRSYQQFSTGSYYLTTSVRSVLDAAPDRDAGVLLEGFGEGDRAPAEEAFVYEMALEQTSGHISLAADVDDRSGLAYFGTNPLLPPIFSPDYRYVLTRIPGVASGRDVIASAPGLALERRRPGLNVFLDYGVETSFAPSDDPLGQAWVAGPLQLVVVGQRGSRSYVRADFDLPNAAAVPAQKGAVFVQHGTQLSVCEATTPSGVAHVADFSLPANVGVLMVSMSASYQKCS